MNRHRSRRPKTAVMRAGSSAPPRRPAIRAGCAIRRPVEATRLFDVCDAGIELPLLGEREPSGDLHALRYRRDCDSPAWAADPGRSRWHCGTRLRTRWHSSAPCHRAASAQTRSRTTRHVRGPGPGLPTSGCPSAYIEGSLKALPQAPATVRPESAISYSTRTRGLVTELSPSGLSTRTPACNERPEFDVTRASANGAHEVRVSSKAVGRTKPPPKSSMPSLVPSSRSQSTP